MDLILKRFLLFFAWSLIMFVPKKSRIRFLPVTICSTFITFVIMSIGKKYKFWSIKGNEKQFMWNLVSILLGFLPIGNFIVFHLTYGNFKKYFSLNFLLNLGYAIFIIPLFGKLNILKYERFNRIWHMITTLSIAVIVYRYQMFLDKYGFMQGKKLVK